MDCSILSGRDLRQISKKRGSGRDAGAVFLRTKLTQPTGNLDSHTSEEVMKLMQDVVRKQKKTLVMVTHDNHLASYADRVFHIIDGKIVKIEENRKEREDEEQ